jgi:hypothetical protein
VSLLSFDGVSSMLGCWQTFIWFLHPACLDCWFSVITLLPMVQVCSAGDDMWMVSHDCLV